MIDLGTIAYNNHWLIVYQIRLLQKYLTDDFELTVYDNSSLGQSIAVGQVCDLFGVRHVIIPTFEGNRVYPKSTHQPHSLGLAHACNDLLERGADHIGFLDHDVFPTKATSLIDLAEPGFFGVGQRHVWSGRRYLWPGLLVFSRAWLNGRIPNFYGIPDIDPRRHGDTGSLLTDLFVDADWEDLAVVDYGYLPIRPDDGFGTQSWTVEKIGDWIHLGNASGWLEIPEPGQRDDLVKKLVDDLWTQ